MADIVKILDFKESKPGEEQGKALREKQRFMGDRDKEYTITLSCKELDFLWLVTSTFTEDLFYLNDIPGVSFELEPFTKDLAGKIFKQYRGTPNGDPM